MHALQLRSAMGAVLLAVTLTVGCRGSRPFGQVVKVSQEPDISTELDAPRQRLATAKPRTSSSEANTSAQKIADSIGDASPHLAQNTSVRSMRNTDVPSMAANGSRRRSAQTPAANRAAQPVAAATTKSKLQQESPGGSGVAQAAQTQVSEPGSSDTPDRESLLATLNGYSPEAQVEALRRVIAASVPSAEKTSQPESPGEQLRMSLADLPQLPESGMGNRSAANPKRLVDSDRSMVSAAANITDLVTTETDFASEASAHAGDDADKDVVRAVVDSDMESSEVKTASASRDVGEQSPAASSELNLAQVDKDSNAAISVTIDDDGQSENVGVPEQLTDAALYSLLVKRLSSGSPDETEADRAGRLIKLRHLMVLSGDPEGAVAKIEGMGEAEQEFLRHQLLGLSTMIDPQGHPVPSRRLSSAIPQFREAIRLAGEATDTLEIRSLDFCTQIESYGQVIPFRNHRFDPGQQVIMYCEVENFTSRDTEEGHETHLQGSYDIYNEQGEKIVSQLLPADQQLSANYLRDYFIAYQMHLPKQLQPGNYRLQLTMEDMNGGKYGQSSIQFEIKK